MTPRSFRSMRPGRRTPVPTGFGAGSVCATRNGEPTAKMASGDPRPDKGNPADQAHQAMVLYRGDATPMEVNGDGGGIVASRRGEEEHRPEGPMLQRVGAVAAAAARRATQLAVAEWTQDTEIRTGTVLREMGQAFEARLQAATDYAEASEQHRGRELQVLQQGMHGRMAHHEGPFWRSAPAFETCGSARKSKRTSCDECKPPCKKIGKGQSKRSVPKSLGILKPLERD